MVGRSVEPIAFAYFRPEYLLLMCVERRVRSLRLFKYAPVGKINPPSAYALLHQAPGSSHFGGLGR